MAWEQNKKNIQSLPYQLTSNENKEKIVLVYGDRIQVRKKVTNRKLKN